MIHGSTDFSIHESTKGNTFSQDTKALSNPELSVTAQICDHQLAAAFNLFLSFPFIFRICTTPSKPFKKIDLSSHHALETGHVALLGGDLEVAVDNTVIVVSMGT
jgi:hypothetical protein